MERNGENASSAAPLSARHFPHHLLPPLLYASLSLPLLPLVFMAPGNSSIHHGRCHDFYVGTAPYTLLNSPRLRIDIIEVVNFVPTSLFLLWLLFTLPWSVARFCRGRKGQTGLVAYFVLIWATALFRGLRFVILWAIMGGDAPTHITKVELVLYALYLTCIDTVEISFIVRPLPILLPGHLRVVFAQQHIANPFSV